jgi:hypothetical protein
LSTRDAARARIEADNEPGALATQDIFTQNAKRGAVKGEQPSHGLGD